MKKLIFGFIVLLVAIWLGYLIHEDAGYLLITYGHWSIETSLWVAIISLILAFLIIYFIIRLIKNTMALSERFRHWGKERNNKKVKKLTDIGLCELAEGDWQDAEHNLIKAAKINSRPLINYLAAARAAQEQQAYSRRDEYLKKAHKTTSGSEIAVGLTQAQLQLNNQQWEQALATLKHLNQVSPKHRYVLSLLKQVYLKLNDWSQLENLLPSLRKNKVLTKDKLEHLERQIHIALFRRTAHTGNMQQLEEAWNTLPKSMQLDLSLVSLYTHHLINNGRGEQASDIIEQTMKKDWLPSLTKNYGLANDENATKRLKIAEAWLKKHPQEPALLLCLGRICMQLKLWGKARDYLEQSLKLAPEKQTFYEYGTVAEAMGEKDAALDYYRKGLELKH